jgi:hypothetical protein
MVPFSVIRTPPFQTLLADAGREHPGLEADLIWLIGRLAIAPEIMGVRVADLAALRLPIYKTRCKDSCHNLGASGGWRIYYAVNKAEAKVFLLFVHHKKDYELPRHGFLLQKIERALPDL